MSKSDLVKRVSIYINGQEIENSLKSVDGQITHVRNSLRKLVEGTEDYDKKKAELTGTLSQLQERQKEYREELGLTTQAQKDGALGLTKFKEALSNIFVGLSSGDLETAKEGFDEIKGSIGGMVKSAAAFVATPLGAAIAVISTIAIATKEIFEFNQNLEQSNKLLRSFGLEGAEMSKVRDEIKATAESFDKEFNEIASKANSLSKTFQISMSDANAIIARGLADGGAQNEEFLDSLGEYDEFFAKAGYSATEFVNVINKGFDIGIYSDKLPDALKEADLSLKEQTKASRDALTNAFGASFTDEILAKVTTGEITTKQALESIAKKAKETGLTQQQQAQLTADVFRGAGEDAGGVLKILEAVGAASKKELSDSTKASLALVDANEKLNKAQSELFEIDGFGTIWTNIKVSAVDALSNILEWVIDIKKDIQPLIDLVSFVFVAAWEALKISAFVVLDGLALAAKIFTFNWSGAIQVVERFFNRFGINVSGVFDKIRNKVINVVQDIVSKIAPLLSALGVDVDKLQKKLDSLKSKNVVLKTTPENGKPTANNPEAAVTKATAEELAKQKALRDAARQKEIDAHQRALDKKKADQEKHDKELWDKALALAKAKTDLAKAELDYFISNNRSKIDSTKQLTPEIIAEETKRLDDIKFQQENALAEKRLNDVAKAEQDAKSAEELAALKLAIDYEYLTAEQNLEYQFLESTTALKKQYEEQQKQLAIEQLQAQNELDVLEADTKLQADKIKQAQEYKAELAGYKKLLDDKKITEAQYTRFENAAKEKQKELDRVRDLQQLQGTLGGLNQVAGAIGEMFGQSKGLAIAQAGINGAMAVTSILAQYPKFDGGFAMWAAIAASGITTIAQIGKITSTKAPKSPKFFYGGFNNSNGSGGPTGTTAHLGNDEFGKITGVTHDEEWIAPKVMTQSPKYAATFSWLENERKRVVGNKYFDGGETSTGTVPPYVENSTQRDDALLIAINRLNDHLDKGIQASTNIGYKDAKKIKELNDEIEMSNQYGIVSK